MQSIRTVIPTRAEEDAHILRVSDQIIAAAEIKASWGKVFANRGSIMVVRQAYNAIRFERNRIIAIPQCPAYYAYSAMGRESERSWESFVGSPRYPRR
jgi:hypothetical protein